MVVGSQKWLTFLGSSPMETPAKRPKPRFKLLPFVLWRTVSNTEKPAPISSLSHLRLHERLVQYACQTCFSRASSHRLDHQATNSFSPHTFPVKKDFSPRARNDKRVRLVAFALWRRYSDSAPASRR